jgi:hypothetical protein
MVTAIQTTIAVSVKTVTPDVKPVKVKPCMTVLIVLLDSSDNQKPYLLVNQLAQITTSLITTEEFVPNVLTHVGNVMDQVLIIVLNVKFHMVYTKDNVKNHVQITIIMKKENA